VKSSITIATAFVLILAGCQKPTEVQLIDEPMFDLEEAIDPDTSFERAAVDTTALLPSEQQRYTGFVTLTYARTDVVGFSRSRVVARVVVEDKGRVLEFNGRRMFKSRQLGLVRLNGFLLLPRERFFGGMMGGPEYLREITDYEPGRSYTFSADSLGSVVLRAPEVVEVKAPTSGSVVRRDHDLLMHWRGRGDLMIIISSATLRPTNLMTTPLLRLRLRQNNGHVMLPKRVINGLPPGLYLFTFVISNREERPLSTRFGGKMLVQASSLHNILVDVR